MFADDTLVICKATSSACSKHQSIDEFCSLPGQLVNFHKSALVFSHNISDSRKAPLASHFNMTVHNQLDDI